MVMKYNEEGQWLFMKVKRSWCTNDLDQPRDKATKMKSDQILFHPVVPKRQGSQNDRLANGTANQNQLAPPQDLQYSTVLLRDIFKFRLVCDRNRFPKDRLTNTLTTIGYRNRLSHSILQYKCVFHLQVKSI